MLAAVLILLIPTNVQAQTPNAQPLESDFTYEYLDRTESFNELAIVAEQEGSVRVIIQLQVTAMAVVGNFTLMEGVSGNEESVSTEQEAIQGLQISALKGLEELGSIENTYKFKHVPFIVTRINLEGLNQLQANPLVIYITQDVAEPLLLSQSIPLIKANLAWDAGFSGAGQTIAIGDTGVDSNHDMLSGKVVSEACYSTTDTIGGSTSLCPNGSNEQIGTGAAVPCANTISGCSHGTHVAGIAAGKTVSSGPVDYAGVAKDANILALQVFSRFDNAGDCRGNPPCVLSYRSDQMKALERVFDLRNTFDISSVNLSLGGGKFTSPCDTDPRKAVIDRLRSAGIATIVASGNDGYTDGIGTPSCISSAISVGSTDDNDNVSIFSNSADFLDLLAPGDQIRSSIPGGSNLGYKSGTSMATPHVAGTWAVMKSNNPTATVQEVLDTLKDKGIEITDFRNGLDFKRIEVYTATLAIPEFPIVLLILALAIVPTLLLLRKKSVINYHN